MKYLPAVLKQEAIKRIFTEYVSAQLVEPISKYGFKYLKSKNSFKKSAGEFDYYIHVGHTSQPLYFDEASERLKFFYSIWVRLELPKYEKWYQKTFQRNFNPWLIGQWPGINAWFPVLFNQFESADFYEPTDSQKFKLYISGLLSKENIPEALRLPDALSELESRLLAFFAQFKTWDDVMEKELYQKVLKNEFMLYAGKKEQYQKACIDLCNKTLEAMQPLKEQGSDDLRHYQEAIQELNRKYQIVFQQDLLASLNYQKLSYEKIAPGPGFSVAEGWNYESIFSISNISPKVMSIDIDYQNRQLIIGHVNNLASLWDFDGNKLREVEIPYGFYIDHAYVGYIKELDCYYVNSFLYDKQLNKIMALPDLGLREGRDPINTFPTVFDAKLLIASQKETAFYTLDGKLIGKHENKYGMLVAVLPKTKRLLYYDDDKYHLVDKDLNVIYVLESGKSNWANATSLSANEQYLFAGGHYTKAYFYDLTKGTRQVLWAHETFKEGYKDKYKNVNHNFGVKAAKFSPDNSYLVAGADHAKDVVWKIPSLERIELQPEHSFTFEGAPPDTISANDIRQIEFLDNGRLFCTVLGSHALFWNNQLQQLNKTGNVGRIKFGENEDYAVITHPFNSLTFYKRK